MSATASTAMTGLLALRMRGFGVIGPGFGDAGQARAVLADPVRRDPAVAPVVPPSERLPAAERRRATALTKLSLAVAEIACRDAGIEDPAPLATVFVTADGDGPNCDAVCDALAKPEPAVSPTRFTNSVHNATAGFWHIALGSQAASTSLAGWRAGPALGLLEAAAQVADGQSPVLLVCSDLPPADTLADVRPITLAFGWAMVLAPASDARGRLLRLRCRPGLASTGAAPDDPWQALADANPSARALPLLAALARAEDARLTLPGWDGLSLEIELDPAA